MSNRLQKKCFIAATSVHLSLMLILLVGPAFLTAESKKAEVTAIDYVPQILIDQALQGGGDRNGSTTPPPPEPKRNDPPQPPKQPDPPAKDPEPDRVEKTPEPRPPKPNKVEEPDEAAVDPKPAKPQTHKVQVNLKEVTTKKPTTNTSKTSGKSASEKAADKERADALAAIKNAAQGVREGVSGGTTITMRGPGGGGPTYASYNSEIQRIYKQRYDLYLSKAGRVSDTETQAEASVTISRDGTVLSSKITKASPSAALNQLVREVLDSVKTLRPFPEGATDSQRTLDIVFELKPRQGLG